MYCYWDSVTIWNGDSNVKSRMSKPILDCFPLQTKNFAPAERKTNRLKRKDLRSACVSKSQIFVSYSVSKGYAVIVARAIMMIWTCAEQIIGAPLDYGQAAHINIVP